MAVSELHNRLEHLVSYSSQLIFVSGETIAQQQSSLQAFLSRQNENTEIAYLTANPDDIKQTYRKQIGRQLLGVDNGMYNRPLNELLAPLNHYEGPVLICICQAENLPQSFLQELWELVLQSRFAANKQHLNVILFGQSDWAAKAKSWLPANNRDKPLLLSHESIAVNAEEQSELDKLIAQKRLSFSQRMQQRQQSTPKREKPALSIWVKILALIVFLFAFGSLLYWQYGDALVGDNVSTIEENSDPFVDPFLASQENAKALPPQPQNPEIKQQPQAMDKRKQDADTTLALPAQTLVGDWPSLQAKSEQQPDTAKDTKAASIKAESALSNPSDTVAQEPTSAGNSQAEDKIDTPLTAENSTQVGAVDGDYKVADIISEAQLEDVPELSDEQQLMALSESDYVIQIAGLSQAGIVKQLTDQYQLEGKLWQYQTERFGGAWHVMLWRQRFDSLQSAKAAIDEFPEELKQLAPFAKSVAQIQQEIDLVNPR